jgi:SAM-dependent methyltransferase
VIHRAARFGLHALPKGFETRLRSSTRIQQLRDQRLASELATTSKRLDLAAGQIAQVLHLAGGTSLRDRTCLEIGSGWVLSHALVFHLLGAKRVIATDIAPIGNPQALRRSIKASQRSFVRDILSTFEDHEAVRRRLDAIADMPLLSFPLLHGIGVDYIAPIDLVQRPFATPVDFIYSASVLEHVPVTDVPALLSNLGSSLAPGGIMIHVIHLEDHLDIEGDPFRFLGAPASQFTADVQSSRGNRLRASRWEAAMALVPGMESRTLYAWQRRDRPLPSVIDPSIGSDGPDDLVISHLAVIGIKEPAG